jgi:aminoglycoside phosphotransferase (APT) family kinase protein
MLIDAPLVRRLIAAQFPQWTALDVIALAESGWDHHTFRLGESLLARLPSAEAYAPQVENEQRVLPLLAPRLPVRVPHVEARGAPGEGYPWRWSVYSWIEGEPAHTAAVADKPGFVRTLAHFLNALQAIEAAHGPTPSADNFFRGGPLTHYDAEARRAFERLGSGDDRRAAISVWDAALSAHWRGAPAWAHGDFAPSNLLVSEGRLAGVIDWGCACAGDPACDLAIAWTFMDAGERAAFREALAPDDDLWARGRGWALWKAAILATGVALGHARDIADAPRVLSEVLADHC